MNYHMLLVIAAIVTLLPLAQSADANAQTDLILTSISISNYPEVNDTVNVTIRIFNNGSVPTNVSHSFSIGSPIGGSGGSACCKELAPFTTDNIMFSFIPQMPGIHEINASVISSVPDTNTSNNHYSIQFMVYPKVTVSPDNDPYLGKSSSQLTLIEFGGFQDPFSGKFWQEALPLLKKNFIDTGIVKYVFRDFPLPFHSLGMASAEASECADEQGKYWLYHSKLMSTQGNHSLQNFKIWALDLGLNVSQFNACLDSRKMESEVKKDIADGKAAGLTGTPSFFFQACGIQQRLQGALPYSAFEGLIINQLLSCNNHSDLEMLSLSYEPKVPKENETVNVTATVRNNGNVPAKVSLNYFISTPEGTTPGPVHYKTLAPNSNGIFSFNFKTNKKGLYKITATAVSEYGKDPNPNNNDAVTFFTIPSEPMILIKGAPKIGSVLQVELYNPSQAGKHYSLGMSFSPNPGIKLPDNRIIPLNPDPLFFTSQTTPGAVGLINSQKTLDQEGVGRAQWSIPNIPSLAGLTVYLAFVTYDPQSTSPIKSISKAVKIKILK